MTDVGEPLFVRTRSDWRYRRATGETARAHSIIELVLQTLDCLDELFDHVQNDCARGLSLVHVADDLPDKIVGQLLCFSRVFGLLGFRAHQRTRSSDRRGNDRAPPPQGPQPTGLDATHVAELTDTGHHGGYVATTDVGCRPVADGSPAIMADLSQPPMEAAVL